MGHDFAVHGIVGREFDDARLVTGLTRPGVVDFKAEPFGGFGPFLHGFFVVVFLGLGRQGVVQIFKIHEHIGGVAGAHQCFGRGRGRFTGNVWLAAFCGFQAGAAGTFVGHGTPRLLWCGGL